MQVVAAMLFLPEPPAMTNASAALSTGGSPISDSATLVASETRDDAVRQSEHRFRELFEEASDGAFIADLDGRLTDVNNAGCRMLGYARKDLIGKTIVDLIPAEAVHRLWEAKEQLLKGGIQVAEWALRRNDGTYLPVEVSAKILPDGRWQWFVRDITERRRTEEALRLSEAKFSGIYSVSADAIISVDEAQRITMFNEGAQSIFGYSKDEIVGSPLEILIPHRFRSIHRRHVEQFSDGQQIARRMGSRSAKIYGLRKNGEEFPTDAAISRLQVGGTTLLIVSIRDISEQVRIENEQRLLAETGDILVSAGSDYQRLLTDVANVVVRNIADWCAVDLIHDGEPRRLRIVHADPAKAAICKALEDYPIDRQRPNPISEAIDTKRPILVSNPSPESLESLARSEEHLQLLRAFDPGSFVVVPLIARGRSLGTIAFGSSQPSRRYGARDVREAEQVASRVALAVDNARLHEALERAIQARDDVLGIVAHDLRSPLNTIVLGAHMLVLKRDGRDVADDHHQKTSERIHRAATSMNRLIQDLLDVTRIEAGQALAINPESISTHSVLTEAIERHQAELSAWNRELRLDETEAPAAIRGDRERVLQVFDNLLGNAIKFSRASITVRAGIRDGEALFSVTDDGLGICAEDLPRLFDRFWQAAKADRRGAGLGLSIVKGIVNAHGGRTWVESAVGVGTTFYFTMPMAPICAR